MPVECFMVRLFSVIVAVGLSVSAATALAQNSEPEFVWVVTESSATRFLEAGSSEVEKTTLGDKLQVVHRKGERIRLRFKGSKFGWVDAATVATTEPSDPPTVP